MSDWNEHQKRELERAIPMPKGTIVPWCWAQGGKIPAPGWRINRLLTRALRKSEDYGYAHNPPYNRVYCLEKL